MIAVMTHGLPLSTAMGVPCFTMQGSVYQLVVTGVLGELYVVF